jgi:hypothetical protein
MCKRKRRRLTSHPVPLRRSVVGGRVIIGSLHSSKGHGTIHEKPTARQQASDSGFFFSFTPHIATNREPWMVDGKIRAKQMQAIPWSRHKGRRS